MYDLLKICVWFTEKMCVLQAGWRTRNRAQELKNPFGGGVGRSIGSRYVQWNPLDSSKTIENLLQKKVAILLRIVAFLALSEKTCWSSEKSCHSSEEKKWVCSAQDISIDKTSQIINGNTAAADNDLLVHHCPVRCSTRCCGRRRPTP